VDKDSKELSNIYQFTSKYCAYHSSDDEDTTNANSKDKKVDSKSNNYGNSDKSDGSIIGSNIKTDSFSGVSITSAHYDNDACSEILSCNIIECLIGNRIFRCMIDIDNRLSTTLEFKEVFTNYSMKKHRKT
jgi:hypothetical protein